MKVLTCVIYFYLLLSCIAAAGQFVQPQDSSLSKKLSSHQTLQGDGYGGAGYTVRPLLSNEQPCTAILIHGLGGTGEEWGFISLAFSFFSLNYVKFVIPSAPTRPVKYLNENLPSWFNIDQRRRLSTILNRTELLESVDRINNIIQGEIRAGVPSERIFVIGFSQGGAVALTTFFRSKVILAGCIGVATWFPLEDDYPRDLSNTIREKDTLLIHGTNDSAIHIDYARQSRDRIKNLGQRVNLTEIEDGSHIVFDNVVMTEIEEFILERANGTSRYINTLLNDVSNTFKKLNSRVSGLRI